MASNLTLSGLLGTLKSTFRINKLTLDASALSVARTVNVPDKTGTLAMTSDITGTNSGTNTGDQINISGSSGSCTGNAATATTLIGDETNWANYRADSVANMLGWKKYGNGCVIFDASASLTPTGVACSSTNSTGAWSANYPTLMGWNGVNTFGVRVDSARISDSTSGNAATAGGFTPSATAAVASRIVVANPNGYILNNYFNSTDNVVGTGLAYVMCKTTGDNFYRSASAAAVADFIKDEILTQVNAVAASGTAIDFTGIPSGVKVLHVGFWNISTNSASLELVVQLGDSGGIEATGYDSCKGIIASTGYASDAATEGFIFTHASAIANTFSGSMTIRRMDTLSWIASAAVKRAAPVGGIVAAGAKTLTGTLDRIRVTSTTGAATFDSGWITLQYE